MEIKYNINIDNIVINKSLKRIINQTYKLLPMREEGSDWQKPLQTIMEELSGINSLLRCKQDIYFSLLSKMEGLFELTSDDDFMLYRRVIFECLGLLNLLVIKNERS